MSDRYLVFAKVGEQLQFFSLRTNGNRKAAGRAGFRLLNARYGSAATGVLLVPDSCVWIDDHKELPLHRWVPWIAGFSAEFVNDCLSKYLQIAKGKRNPWVLDPFAGVGTTLVEAYVHGSNVVGFEINPYAALAARLKLQAEKIELRIPY